MKIPAYRNTILSRLPAESVARLQLHRVEMERRHAVETPGNEIRHLFFLETGIASMTCQFRDGSEVEVGMIGCEGVMGVSVLIGTRRSLNNVYMQLAGWGYACRTEVARKEFHRGEHFHDMALRYVQAQLIQTAQTAGCNARHHLDQRLARWLLLCMDRAESGVMDLTQEFLAAMLGVERPAVSGETAKLQAQGLIVYRRGKVQVLDRKGLEKISCECYELVSRHLNSYAVDDDERE